mmetsp:Transcript_8170/g.11910  ORF Transcript_8170/g.11910 Transcript_8170/m.11910 type:complete len:200 (-) Transcript_8170:320-919(-)
MPHAAPWRCSHPSNEPDNRFFRVTILFEPFGGFFLGTTSNFTNHNNSLSLGIIRKSLQAIDEVGSIERIAANSNTGGLAQTSNGRLMHCLVGKSSTATDNADFSRFVNVTRHDSDLTFPRLYNSRAVGSDESRGRLSLQHGLDPSHILLRNALRDGNNQGNFRLNGIHNSLSTKGRGYIDDRCVGLHRSYRFRDSVKDR